MIEPGLDLTCSLTAISAGRNLAEESPSVELSPSERELQLSSSEEVEAMSIKRSVELTQCSPPVYEELVEIVTKAAAMLNIE
ncbi:hypothetical protein Baya_3294 [Bagarius yarrelli]|uniref:Uncharacterized protein n=1 Tax=Bagarius yarrelli TaxID=175774 RepID=A0A556TS78_BAGYA|nr:hypothetical protein Baya_3294 [Bagarius yarrelli]